MSDTEELSTPLTPLESDLMMIYIKAARVEALIASTANSYAVDGSMDEVLVSLQIDIAREVAVDLMALRDGLRKDDSPF